MGFMKTIDTLACSKDDERSIRMTVVDWAYLICPGIVGHDECVQEAHGFDQILPDESHPSGDSGLWLTKELLALIVADIAQHLLPDEEGSYSSFTEALTNPISEQLLTLAPPDENPELRKLVAGYYLCPNTNEVELQEKFNDRNTESYASYRDSSNYSP